MTFLFIFKTYLSLFSRKAPSRFINGDCNFFYIQAHKQTHTQTTHKIALKTTLEFFTEYVQKKSSTCSFLIECLTAFNNLFKPLVAGLFSCSFLAKCLPVIPNTKSSLDEKGLCHVLMSCLTIP